MTWLLSQLPGILGRLAAVLGPLRNLLTLLTGSGSPDPEVDPTVRTYRKALVLMVVATAFLSGLMLGCAF